MRVFLAINTYKNMKGRKPECHRIKTKSRGFCFSLAISPSYGFTTVKRALGNLEFNRVPKSTYSWAQILALVLGSSPNASGLAIFGFEKFNMLDEQVPVVFIKAKSVSFVILDPVVQLVVNLTLRYLYRVVKYSNDVLLNPTLKLCCSTKFYRIVS